MTDRALLVLAAADVASLMHGHEAAIMEAVARAYETHGRGRLARAAFDFPATSRAVAIA